ncbi:MAG: FHA domain-containing protein [Polyangiaceae bacterium]|nr:FHA domain-containing protein [Myxococcales bacterium]MCB9587880.1 FHA domain-containing protein [Polyangiaceae bacterium]MCB9608829.1 FHA domain-containing protein [Polyangiaceae bacterium]
MAVALKISGPEGERRVNVSGSVKLGRASGCDVVLKHPSVSAEALLVRRDGAGAIADPLGGVVALNDARMQSKHQLKDGDELKVGPYRVKVLLTGSLSVRPPSVRPGDLAPASTRPPLTLPPGSAPLSMRPSAPPPAPVELSESERVRILSDARARLTRGEKRSIVLSKLGEAGLQRGEAAAHIEDVISQLRGATKHRARRRALLGFMLLLLGLVATAYFAKFIPSGIGEKVLALRLPHAEQVLLFAGEHWLGPAVMVLGALVLLAALFRLLRGDPRFNR